MAKWQRRLRALVPGSLAARGLLLIALAAGAIAVPGIILFQRLLEAQRQRAAYSDETFLALALATCFENTPEPVEEEPDGPRRVAELSRRVSWAGVFDAARNGVELRRQTALPQQEILDQVDFAARTPQTAPLLMNGVPSRRFELLTLPQPESGVTLAAIVDRGSAVEHPRAVPWIGPAGLMLAGLAGALAWLQYGIERPIRRLGDRQVGVRAGLTSVALDAVLPRELGELAQSITETQSELQKWRGEAVHLRRTVEARVDARTRRATQAQRRAEREADTDALTSLANRRAFERDGPALSAAVLRDGSELALVMLDVNGLKRFNDALGHVAGDKLLVFVGELLRASIRRGTDRAMRYGGDEFVLLLPGTLASEACDIAQRLAALFAQWARTLTGVESLPGLSAGVAALCADATGSWAELVRLADEAMYWARGRGRPVASIAEVRAARAPADPARRVRKRGPGGLNAWAASDRLHQDGA